MFSPKAEPMSIWRKWWTQLIHRGEPKPIDILRAHLQALMNDPLAAPVQSPGVSLQMSDDPGPRCLVVELGLSRLEAYLQPGNRLRIETSGDALLLQSLPQETYQSLLRQFDMSFHPASGVLRAHLKIATRKERMEACTTIERIVVELLESQAGSHYSVAIERQRRPDNRALIAQIKQLVIKRDMESRRLVYQSIIQGQFYFPVEFLSSKHCAPVPTSWQASDSDSDRPGWAIFSNEASLPKGDSQAFLLISGIRLVQAVTVHDIGGLQLNPGAEYGGELYRHELDSLGDYLRTLGMMNLETRRDGVIH